MMFSQICHTQKINSKVLLSEFPTEFFMKYICIFFFRVELHVFLVYVNFCFVVIVHHVILFFQGKVHTHGSTQTPVPKVLLPAFLKSEIKSSALKQHNPLDTGSEK
jgi:hypothetical protein